MVREAVGGRLSLETRKMRRALSLLAHASEIAPEVVQSLFGTRKTTGKLFHATSKSTARKRECVVSLEPTEFLLGFLAAFRARKLNRKVIKGRHPGTLPRS